MENWSNVVNWNDTNEQQNRPPWWMLEYVKIDYKITHIGNGEFEITGDKDEILVNPRNLKSMIRYTYFEDYTLPKIGWKTTKNELFKDYVIKFRMDTAAGKIKSKI